MLHHICEMSKMTMKELLRNKGFLFFAIILPVLATMLLNVYAPWEETKEQEEIQTLDGLNTQMAYLEDVEKFQVKVYNDSDTAESRELLNSLAKSGMFQMFQVKSGEYREEEIQDSAIYSAKHDRIDAIMILRADFAERLQEGNLTESVALYRVGDDERYEWFQECLESNLLAMVQREKITADEVNVKEIRVEVLEPEREQSMLEMDVNWYDVRMFGYALALYTVAFLFAGIMILGTIITELQSLVYTRVLISNASPYAYILSKFAVIVCCAILETCVAVLSYVTMVKVDVGLNIVQFACILFGMALIFTSLSVSIGVCCGNTLTACVPAFSIWMVSSLIGGLYFDISRASDTYKKIALLMPQRWGLQAASFFIGDSGSGYSLMTMVTVTYVLLIFLISVLGLKFSSDRN